MQQNAVFTSVGTNEIKIAEKIFHYIINESQDSNYKKQYCYAELKYTFYIHIYTMCNLLRQNKPLQILRPLY